ncbi:MAG: signal peptidase I [Eubacterium sp.]|nr:signal peptidase I [Eubacterium sp.]
MSKRTKIILKTISTLLVALVVVLALLLVGVRFLNMQVFTVLSGSMEPTYKTGSLMYVKDVDPMELEDGDVITYILSENTIVTHRIVDVIPAGDGSEELFFQTKGDANNVVDGSLVYYKNVIGKPVFSIPGLGYLVNFIQQPPGIYIAILFCVGLIFIVFLIDMLISDSEKQKNRLDKISETEPSKKEAEETVSKNEIEKKEMEED